MKSVFSIHIIIFLSFLFLFCSLLSFRFLVLQIEDWRISSMSTQGATKDCASRINSAYKNLFIQSSHGEYLPPVCAVCDEFVPPRSLCVLPLLWLKDKERIELLRPSWQNLTDDLRASYIVELKAQIKQDDPWYNDDVINSISTLLLSPRCTYTRDLLNKNRSGLSCCKRCRTDMQTKTLPLFAIKNNYCLGTTPDCLTQLTDLEIAYLTPVKHYGYCFVYTGGRCLEGSMSFYRVKVKSIVRAVTQLEVLGLQKDIVVLFYGKLTPNQRKRAEEKTSIRVEYVMRAIEWLLEHNVEWQKHNVNLDEIREELSRVKPVFVDDSVVLEEETNSNNVEDTESYRVYFPDGTLDEETAGHGCMERFKEALHYLKIHGYNVEYQCKFGKEAVSDFEDNNLVNSCLLQFPYGRGGLHENRLNKKGNMVSWVNADDYIAHLSRLSKVECQAESFVLIMYNMFMRRLMLRSAGWKMRNKLNASQIATELTKDDLHKAIRNRKRNFKIKTAGGLFIHTVDAVTDCVPHSNGATRKARLRGEALCHEFGTPNFFLTVTPDDETSFFIMLYTYNSSDAKVDPTNMTDEDIAEHLTLRRKLRIKFPGVCALYFEHVLDIIIREVVGWDETEGMACPNGGLFGVPLAFVAAVEEQGRKALHAHLLLWIKDMNRTHDDLHSASRYKSRNAKRKLVELADEVISTELVSKRGCYHNRFNTKQGPFVHDCARSRTVTVPRVVDDQSIRNLRNKCSKRNSCDAFAFCEKKGCTKVWNADDIIGDYLSKGRKLNGINKYPDDVNRLKCMILQNQHPSVPVNSFIEQCIPEASYNIHRHTASCFKNSNNKRQCDDATESTNRVEECRYRLPRRKKARTTVEDATDKPLRWYNWNGTYTERNIKELVMKRNDMDAFQNESCKAVTLSQLACNTNLSLIAPGPVAAYIFKYQLKDTQKDDTKDYERVSETTEKTLEQRKHECDRPEALRRVLAASFAHQKKGIIGSAMAAYITRNGSRFRMSHDSVWVPLRDTYNLMVGRPVGAVINDTRATSYFVCNAMHYLCRPRELEHLNIREFFTKYQVVSQTKKNLEENLQFTSTAEFTHPSYCKRSGIHRQGVCKRDKLVLARVYQRDFIDSENFEGDILDSSIPINEKMEHYSRQALLLISPYRKIEDIIENGSFTQALRMKISRGLINPSSLTVLQNLQDTAHNCWKVNNLKDDLQRVTTLLGRHEFDVDLYPDDQEGQNDINTEPDYSITERWLMELDKEHEHLDPSVVNALPLELDSEMIKKLGTHLAGQTYLSERSIPANNTEFLVTSSTNTNTGRASNSASINNQSGVAEQPRGKDVVSLLVYKTTRKTRTFKEITGSDKQVEVLEANGSAKSIIDWSRKANIDKQQQRAFEIMTSSFILTYHRVRDLQTMTAQDRSRLISETQKLFVLAACNTNDRRKKKQLIGLLHGPGGSGKSTCIDLMTLYAKEFCGLFNNPEFAFTTQTVVVTALTGVAASILNGETVHKKLYLNRKHKFDPSHIEIWSDTRFLVIDEISFCDKDTMKRIHSHLSKLRQDPRPFGGINIVFAGDFRQLEPVGKTSKPLYEENCPVFRDKINCYMELNGMHRFAKDIPFGELLMRMRDGTVTKEDIDTINTRVVNEDTELPLDLRYATYRNIDRDAINGALFEARCAKSLRVNGNTNDCVMIFADSLKYRLRPNVYRPYKYPQKLWKNCTEDHIVNSEYEPRMDPVLKLYKNCPVMLPKNIDVKNGMANGTRATVNKVVLKNNETPKLVNYAGMPIQSVLASQVEYVELKYEKPTSEAQTFTVSPESRTFKAKMPVPEAMRIKEDEKDLLGMKGTQLPLLVNNATTGHKLQGATINSLFVHCWRYEKNWPYVVLSRVKTLQGLFLRDRLTQDLRKFDVPDKLKIMMREMRKYTPPDLTDDEYSNLTA